VSSAIPDQVPPTCSDAAVEAVGRRLPTDREATLRRVDELRRRRPRLSDDRITLAHGAGGKASAALIDAVFLDAFGQPDPAELLDAAVIDLPGGRLAFSTDSFVVSPLRFPGGSLGDLAVNGTVNDLAVSGARPRWLSAAFILEEGLPIDELRGLVDDMRRAAQTAGVAIVTGDTKVVPKGAADACFITTSGLGLVPGERRLGAARVAVGDKLVCSGPIAGHGIAVMIARHRLALDAAIASDTAPLNGLVEALYEAVEPGQVRWLRDATRGGLGTVANELAQASGLGLWLADDDIPVDETVRAACDMLGIDPLHVANEGCFVAALAADGADAGVVALRRAGAAEATVIGQVVADPPGLVVVENALGGSRLVDRLVGDALPRIC